MVVIAVLQVLGISIRLEAVEGLIGQLMEGKLLMVV
jgi:hypothetical protein